MRIRGRHRRNEVGTGGVPRRLSGRILALTLFPILLAIGVAVALVDRQVGELTEREIETQLTVADRLARDLLRAREEDLLTEAWVVARDPKFFAMLAPMGIERDSSFRRTLDDIAAQFAVALNSDLLEILDESGSIQSQWEKGRTSRIPVPRDVSSEPDVVHALQGAPLAGTRRVGSEEILQIATVPVFVGDRIVGVLRHGRRVDAELLGRIRGLTRCEVAFTAGGEVVKTTLLDSEAAHLQIESPLPGVMGETISVRLYRSIEPEERFLASLRIHLLLIGLSVLAASLIFARHVVGKLTGPVDELVLAAIRLERGEEDAPVDIRTGDELEYLGRRFVEMRSTLQSQIRSLREVDRMKSMFLTIASHELRTPATIIQGNVELLEYIGGPDDEQYPEVIDGLRRGVQRLQGVLERISDMSLVDGEKIRLSMRVIDASELLPDLVANWRQMSEGRRLEFRTELPAGIDDSRGSPFLVQADAGRVRQAVRAVLHNAIRFTPDGGQVTLHLRAEPGFVVFEVEDTGVGVRPEHRDRIFESFFEERDVLTHRSGDSEFGSSGLGLGLALARSIVQAHRGRLRYLPRPAGGSRFLIELPAAEPATARNTEVRAA